MKAWTGFEIEEERERLEREAATILGFMIFEYSRLEMELGWFLSWTDNGQSLDKLTKRFATLDFGRRLKYLKQSVASKYTESPEIVRTYRAWLTAADKIRALRNQLFHGRWGVEPIEQRVVNIVGLPNSLDQKSTPYTIADLEVVLQSTRDLRKRLQELRSLYPV